MTVTPLHLPVLCPNGQTIGESHGLISGSHERGYRVCDLTRSVLTNVCEGMYLATVNKSLPRCFSMESKSPSRIFSPLRECWLQQSWPSYVLNTRVLPRPPLAHTFHFRREGICKRVDYLVKCFFPSEKNGLVSSVIEMDRRFI